NADDRCVVLSALWIGLLRRVVGFQDGSTLDRAVEIVADDIRTRRALAQAPVLRGYAETMYRAKSWSCPSVSTTSRPAGRWRCCCAPARHRPVRRSLAICAGSYAASAGTGRLPESPCVAIVTTAARK